MKHIVILGKSVSSFLETFGVMFIMALYNTILLIFDA